MSANPNDVRRGLRQRLGSRVTRRANTKPGKSSTGQNRPYRPSPATLIRVLAREAGL